MSELVTNLKEAINQSTGQYYRLVILAGGPHTGKTAAMHVIAQQTSNMVINVNLELSKRLLELTRVQRSRQAERVLKDVIASVPGDVVLLDNLEILFDTSLELEPLRLLQVASRNRTIVASWNGSYREGTLTYAAPGHGEFMQFKETEAIVVVAESKKGS